MTIDMSPETQPATEQMLNQTSSSDNLRRTGPAKKSGLLHNVIIPLALLAVGGGVVLALGSVKPEQHAANDMSLSGRMKKLAPVRVQAIRSLEASGATLLLEVDGTVVPYREAAVAAEIAGRVVFKADDCEAGNFVKKGQLLMRLDPTDYELELQRVSRLQEQEYEAIGEVDQEIANAKRLIDVAQEDMQLQQNEVDRQNSLPQGFASRGEVDQSKRALLQARQQLVSSENQLELLKQRRSRLEASERLAATQLMVAKVNLARAEIVAPIDGVIVSEEADLNTFVARGSQLVTIEDTSKVEVATNLRMDQLYWVLDQAGRTTDDLSHGYDLPETPAVIEFELTGREGDVHQWNGRLLGYDGIGMDAATRTVPIRVLVDDPKSFTGSRTNEIGVSGTTALVRGMYVRVKLMIKPKTPLVVIPAEALKPGNRVWEYVIDEMVLDESLKKMVADKNDRDARQQDSTGDESLDADANDESSSRRMGDGFDAGQWVAGRVLVRESVIPVDSLSVANYPQDSAGTSEMSKTQQQWVCESRDETLRNGSFVVVSPLGSVDAGSLPARTRRAMVDADAALLESRATETK